MPDKGVKTMSKKVAVPMDGNEAAAYNAYAFTEVAAIYPITPSSPMAEKTDEWSATGRKNIFGQTVNLVEMQSEAGAIGAVHGALEAGCLATSFTSSQGLMLMIPVMYRIAGSRLPAVIHVASRTVGTHAMSIFGDHSDVMACRGTGFAMLSSGSVQEVMDLGGAAHLSAVKASIPFMHFFDGFRTSHEIQKVECIDYKDLEALLDKDALKAFRDNALNPEHPTLRNTVQNPDVYFQFREANNRFYDGLPAIVEDYLNRISEITGRNYGLFNYYGDPEAERVIIAMGSVSGTIREVVEYLNAKGEKVGFVQIHLYRPFSIEYFFKALPKSVKRIAVLDRCKEHGALGEPIYEDVCTAFARKGGGPMIIGGRYGLSSKDTDPSQIKAVFDELKKDEPKNGFTIGIVDDVTHLSLDCSENIKTGAEGTVSCKMWGLGSDGTVGANKNSIRIISENTDLYTQGYFEYDTKKSFGITRSHLRFGKEPILGTYLVKDADLVACHNQSFVTKYDMLAELREGGVFLLNCEWSEAQLEEKLPASIKRQLAEKKAQLYIIDANSISNELGLGNHANMVLQAAFFRLADIIPAEEAKGYMKEAVVKTYGAKGENIVAMNIAAVERGMDALVKAEVPEAWKNAEDCRCGEKEELPAFIKNILIPENALKGDDLPVSTFIGYENGTMPLGTSAYEKRGIATKIPVWEPAACLQCNRCALVCSHGVIRPYLLTEEEANAAPEGFAMCDAKGKPAQGYKYAIQISALDCTSCGSCASVCPAKDGAIHMKSANEVTWDREAWEYGLKLSDKELFSLGTVKGSQFRQPLLEFSGACAGCGETPYAKLLTQLFGDRVYWANATGCSQAWSAAMPCIPYTVNKDGRGPAWSNSLFEDNAEFSLGMSLAVKQQRALAKQRAEALCAMDVSAELKAALGAWLEAFDSGTESRQRSDELLAALEKEQCEGEAENLRAALIERADQLARKTVWMYGGDGWAYDIGYGGLDHVFASGEDINVFVIDTEVYSNTGGQSSKATPLGAVAQFQSSGKKTGKKDLGKLMMSYGNVYVAQVAMGADPSQLIKALIEADSFPGPSLVIGYTPCTAHGIKCGMNNAQKEMEKAVKAGYWQLYRYDPRNTERPFVLDSAEPTESFEEFLDGEVRYASLRRSFPDNANELFAKAKQQAKEKYESYRSMDKGIK